MKLVNFPGTPVDLAQGDVVLTLNATILDDLSGNSNNSQTRWFSPSDGQFIDFVFSSPPIEGTRNNGLFEK